MAFRQITRRSGVLPFLAGSFIASSVLFPKTTLYAEEPQEPLISRKPIYDNLPRLSHQHKPTPSTSDPSNCNSSSPTPTDRLASQIQLARLFIHAQSQAAEIQINVVMARALNLESSFTSTVASLAPAPSTNERILPGGLYVLVAAMAGSIISRNRNILIRASFPLAVGIGAGSIVLPHTIQNVGKLLWKYEEKVPVLAENHLRIRMATKEIWRQIMVHWILAEKWGDERVKEGREAMEGWVRKGR